MSFLDFFKSKKTNDSDQVLGGIRGLIINGLKDAGYDTEELEELLENMEPPKIEPIKEDKINDVISDIIDTGAVTSQLAKKYDSVKALSNNEIEVTLTAAEQELLTKFVTPTDIEYWYKQDYLSYWNSVLPREIKQELNFFIENQILIEETSLAYKLESKSDAELKTICKENGLKVSGRKPEKAQRIAENIPELANKLVGNKKLYKCNNPVVELINHYEEKKEKEEKEFEENFINLCFKKQYQDAINEYLEWNKTLVFQHDTSTYILNRKLFELKMVIENIPSILNNIPENLLYDARKVAIRDILFNTNTYISGLYQSNYKYSLKTCSLMLLFYARNCYEVYQARITQQEQPELDIKFEVHCYRENACYECCMNSDKEFTLDNPPELPNPNCKNENGCSCFIRPKYNRKENK